MSDSRERPAPCPMCGAALSPISAADFHNHPGNDCILSGFEISADDVWKWNRRAPPASTSSVIPMTVGVSVEPIQAPSWSQAVCMAVELWCVHLTHSDEIFAAPSFEEAQYVANGHNLAVGYTDATVKPWPHAAEGHAQDVAGIWPLFERETTKRRQVAVAFRKHRK